MAIRLQWLCVLLTCCLVVGCAAKDDDDDKEPDEEIVVWSAVSAGASHTLALKTDGTLWAWGMNNDGQLGIGTWRQWTTPVQVGSGKEWVFISAGGYHTMGLKKDKTLWCWVMEPGKTEAPRRPSAVQPTGR